MIDFYLFICFFDDICSSFFGCWILGKMRCGWFWDKFFKVLGKYGKLWNEGIGLVRFV